MLRSLTTLALLLAQGVSLCSAAAAPLVENEPQPTAAASSAVEEPTGQGDELRPQTPPNRPSGADLRLLERQGAATFGEIRDPRLTTALASRTLAASPHEVRWPGLFDAASSQPAGDGSRNLPLLL
jgi:hypothetical protein